MMLIWGSISTSLRTPLSCVLQKWVTPNHSHSCPWTHCIPSWRTLKRTFLAMKLQERLGSGARVEIPCSGLSFGVTSSLSKPQPRIQDLMLWVGTKGNSCTCSSTQRQNPPSTAPLPLPILPTWMRTGSQSLPALLISTAPAPDHQELCKGKD